MTPYYQDASVVLYHGDCREILPSLQLAPDATIADPPYTQTSLDWDRWPEGWLNTVAAMSRSLWCYGSLRLFMDRAGDFSDAGWRLSQDVIWEKHNGSNSSNDRFRRVHEQIAHFYRGPWGGIYHAVPKTNDARARTVRRKRRPLHWGEIGGHRYVSVDGGPLLMRSVIYVRSTHGHAENETQKPEGIAAPLIEYACPPKGLVVVPFVGSGTDLVIAKLTGRRAVGVELREQQCEVAAKRLQSGLPLEMESA